MKTAPSRRSYRSLASQIESLEQRVVFSVLTVNTIADNLVADANLSFREAMLLINNAGDANLALGRTLTAGELGQINITEPFGTDDEIRFTDALDGQTITLASEVTISTRVTIHGDDDISFSGGVTQAAHRAFFIASTANATIEDTIITNFSVTGTAGVTGGNGDGGAIYLDGGSLTLRDVDFVNNTANGGAGSTTAGNGRGGAVFKTGGGELDVIGSTFTSNFAVGGAGSDGGGQGGAIFSASTTNVVWLRNSDFNNNQAVGDSSGPNGGIAEGGAVYTAGGSVNVINANFTGNKATSGAGTAITGVAGRTAAGGAIWNDGLLDIDNTLFNGNNVVGASRTGTNVDGGDAEGGAIYTENTTTIEDTTLSFNTAGGGNANGSNTATGGAGTGGAVHAEGIINIERSLLASNIAAGGVAFGGVSNTGGDGSGGGIYTEGDLQLINSTVVSNTADGGGAGAGRGGGVFVDSTDVAINFATIAANTAAEGAAGVHLDMGGGEVVAVTNSILSNAGDDILRTGSAPSLSGSNNLIRTTNLGGLGIISTADPILLPLANNGGPTQTMLLDPRSPAINAGGATAVTTDQRGFPRVRDGQADLGAVEVSTKVTVTGIANPAAGIQIARDGVAQASIISPFSRLNQPRFATGDINNDDIDDVIVASGPGYKNRIVVYSSTDHAVLANFQPFAPRYGGGLFVASADVNNDGFDDIIVGRGAGPSQVLVFSGNGLGLLADFRPFAGGGGARVAAADQNGDGFAEIIVATGAGRRADVAVFDGQQVLAGTALPNTFSPFGLKYRGGLYVATGDTNGDGTPDIIVSKAAPKAPAVSVFNGTNLSQLATFTTPSSNGIRIAAYDYNGDGADDIYTSVTTGGQSQLKVFSGADQSLLLTQLLNTKKPLFIA